MITLTLVSTPRIASLITNIPVLSYSKFRVNPFKTSATLVANSSDGDVASTCGTGVLSSMAWIWMNVVRHQKKQEFESVRPSS